MREVKYIDRGVEHVGTYRVDGWMLEVTSAYGTLRVALGLFEPKALARKLMKVLVTKTEREVIAAAPSPTCAQRTTTRIAAPPIS